MELAHNHPNEQEHSESCRLCVLIHWLETREVGDPLVPYDLTAEDRRFLRIMRIDHEWWKAVE